MIANIGIYLQLLVGERRDNSIFENNRQTICIANRRIVEGKESLREPDVDVLLIW